MMLTEKELKLMVREHENVIEFAPLSNDAVEFYKTRLDLLYFIIEATSRVREPPTDNSTLLEHQRS